MRFLALASVVFLAGVQVAQGGAWLGEKGTGFAAGSGTLTQDDFYSGSAYAEYGLTDRLTLGLDATADMDPFGVITGDGTLFLRWPLGSVDGPSRWAMHVGAGARYQELMFFPSIEVGLSLGARDQMGRALWLARHRYQLQCRQGNRSAGNQARRHLWHGAERDNKGHGTGFHDAGRRFHGQIRSLSPLLAILGPLHLSDRRRGADQLRGRNRPQARPLVGILNGLGDQALSSELSRISTPLIRQPSPVSSILYSRRCTRPA